MMRRYFSIMALAALAATCPAQTYQLVLDGEDSAWRSMSPAWVLDKTGGFLGNYKFSAEGPGTGANRCAWDIDAIPPGTYDVEFYVDNGNFAADAQYIVEHDGGITTVAKSQNFVAAGWHSLGTFNFTNAGRVTQTDYWTGAGTKVISDALRITLQGTPALPPAETSVPPEVSIVMDDLGGLNPNNSSSYAYASLRAEGKVTFAIIPGLTYSTTVLDVAEANDKQCILHQPMQYYGQPDSNPGDPRRLYISLNANQIKSVLDTNLVNLVPGIRGINNHQGSRFSQYTTGMHTVLDHLKSKDMFFFDSRTISDAVGYDLSRKKGMLSAERDAFVDGTSNAHTRQLINDIGTRALYAPNYSHIMICHERENTVTGLQQAIADMQALGITVKSLERDLAYVMEVDDLPEGASISSTGTWNTNTRDMISHECTDGFALEADNGSFATLSFMPHLPQSGQYRIFVGAGHAADALPTHLPVLTLTSTRGSAIGSINQAANRNRWVYWGTRNLDAGSGNATFTLQVAPGGEGKTYADAIKLVYDGPIDDSSVADWSLYTR